MGETQSPDYSSFEPCSCERQAPASFFHSRAVKKALYTRNRKAPSKRGTFLAPLEEHTSRSRPTIQYESLASKDTSKSPGLTTQHFHCNGKILRSNSHQPASCSALYACTKASLISIFVSLMLLFCCANSIILILLQNRIMLTTG